MGVVCGVSAAGFQRKDVLRNAADFAQIGCRDRQNVLRGKRCGKSGGKRGFLFGQIPVGLRRIAVRGGNVGVKIAVRRKLAFPDDSVQKINLIQRRIPLFHLGKIMLAEAEVGKAHRKVEILRHGSQIVPVHCGELRHDPPFSFGRCGLCELIHVYRVLSDDFMFCPLRSRRSRLYRRSGKGGPERAVRAGKCRRERRPPENRRCDRRRSRPPCSQRARRIPAPG